MNSFFRDITARRKIILYFFAGILIPSLIVGYLSWDALSKRREAFRSVIESQLWISGESAIKSIESALQDFEEKMLSQDNFQQFLTTEPISNLTTDGQKKTVESFFLLNADFQIIYPSVGKAIDHFFPGLQSVSGSPFWNLYQRAEYFEFNSQNYSRAAEIYQQCFKSTSIKQLQAYAWEGYGRCLIAMQKKAGALLVYQELLDNYSLLLNKAGHPYGLLAALRLAEISREVGKSEDVLDTIVKAYIKLRQGEWQLRYSVFDFYTAAIEAILYRELSAEKQPELWNSYSNSKAQHSHYIKELEFVKRLDESVIPVLKEKIAFSQYANEAQKGRFSLTLDDSFYLISYTRLRDSNSNQLFYAGFKWDLIHVKNSILPEIAETITQTSTIAIQVLDEEISSDIEHATNIIPKNALSLSSRQFPFPWRFIITQTAVSKLKDTAWKENLFHIALLAIIVGLMCLGAILIARDISRESEINQKKSEFVHNISHELKTPLTLIRLYGETLKDKQGLDKETKQKAYQVITRESERLSIMINNVLDFSRLEMGKKEFVLKPGDISKAVTEILESYRYHFEEKEFKLHEQIETGFPLVKFNREALASVLINLLSNAVKFSPKRKEITVRLLRQGNFIVLQVSDQGIGITKKDLDNIFKRFFRSDNEVVSSSKGSGLGLTIIQHIAEAHNGKVSVKSEPGKGSEFSFYLPFCDPKEVKQ